MATEAGKHKRKQNWKRMTGMALILFLTLGIVWHARKRSLLEQSTRVAIIQDVSVHPVHWLSDHKILLGRGPEHEGLYLYDIDTQKETLLRSVSRELQKANFMDYLGSNFERRVETLRVSPNGMRLLWSSGETHYEGSPGLDRIYGAWLDGSHYFEYAPSAPARSNGKYVLLDLSQVQWTGDSRYWVAFVTDAMAWTPMALLYDGEPSRNPDFVPTTTTDGSVRLHFIGSDLGLGLVLDNHLFAWAPNGYMEVTPAIDILDIGIGAHTLVKKRAIPLLPNTTLVAVAFSPQGDRIAWQQTREEISEWVRILQRWFPQMHNQGVQTESLWVSRLDGTQMHEIGSRKLEAGEQFVPQLNDLQWVPGAKRLGFRYGAVFYTVSAE